MKVPAEERFSAHSTFLMVLLMSLSVSRYSCGERGFRPAIQRPDCSGGAQTVTITVDKKAKLGVDEETVYVCPGDSVVWQDRRGEDWHLEFKDQNNSPFSQGEVKLKKGDRPSPIKNIPSATEVPFPYSITVDGTPHDPQIIIMGK